MHHDMRRAANPLTVARSVAIGLVILTACLAAASVGVSAAQPASPRRNLGRFGEADR